MKAVFLVLLIMLTFTSKANVKIIGNGGDVIVCRDDQEIISIELLDIYEGRHRDFSFEIEKPETKDETFAIAKSLIQRFSRLNSYRMSLYLDWLSEFKNSEGEVKFLRGHTLTDIPDSGHLSLSAGCKIEQLVIQISNPDSWEPRYLINQDLWEQMDPFNRAATLLHEFIYRDAIHNDLHENSIVTRKLVRHILANRIKDQTLRSYYELLKKWRLTAYFQFGKTVFPVVYKRRKADGSILEGTRRNISWLDDNNISSVGRFWYFDRGENRPQYKINLGNDRFTYITESGVQSYGFDLCRDGMIENTSSRFYSLSSTEADFFFKDLFHLRGTVGPMIGGSVIEIRWCLTTSIILSNDLWIDGKKRIKGKNYMWANWEQHRPDTMRIVLAPKGDNSLYINQKWVKLCTDESSVIRFSKSETDTSEVCFAQ